MQQARNLAAHVVHVTKSPQPQPQPVNITLTTKSYLKRPKHLVIDDDHALLVASLSSSHKAIGLELCDQGGCGSVGGIHMPQAAGPNAGDSVRHALCDDMEAVLI